MTPHPASVVLVEFRQAYSAALTALFAEKNIWPPGHYAETDTAYVARDREDALRFCRENTDYADHNADEPWHFTLLTAAVADDDPAAIRVLGHVDWHGSPIEHADGGACDECPLCNPGGNPEAYAELSRAAASSAGNAHEQPPRED